MFSEDEKSLTELIKAFRAALQTPPRAISQLLCSERERVF
jgi:hypothetical protein